EAIRRRLPQTLAGRDSTPAEGALADTGGASETDDSAAGDATAAGAAAGSAAAGAAAAGATAEGEDAADSGSSAARADPADDHGSADADSPADDDPATDEGSEPSDSAAAESPSAGRIRGMNVDRGSCRSAATVSSRSRSPTTRWRFPVAFPPNGSTSARICAKNRRQRKTKTSSRRSWNRTKIGRESGRARV